MRLGQQQLHATVFEHVGQALRRVFRVQRHVSATGLEHGQQANNHFDGALHRQPDQHVRAHAGFDQAMSQAVGAAIQFGVAQELPGKDQGWRIRLCQHPGFNQLMHPLTLRVSTLGGIPLTDPLLALRGSQHRQILQSKRRIGNCRTQQAQPMPDHARSSDSTEQISGISEGSPQAIIGFLGVQAQVELGALGVPL